MIAFDGGYFAFINKLINGDMDIWQRGTTFTVSASSVYTADRWAMYTDTLRPGRGNITQSSDVPSNSEFQTSLQFQVTTVSNANNQPLTFRQIIEGYNARDLIGQTFNISFWVKSSKTGTYSVCLGNAGNGMVSDRSYVTEYTINTNNWEKKTIVVPGGLITAGTWNWTNGRGLEVIFGMAGAGTSTPLNTWVTGNIETSPNQVNLLDVVGNTFNITGVQLERGVAATPFEHRPIGTELALCHRYYNRESWINPDIYPYLCVNGYMYGTTQWEGMYFFPVEMRTPPLFSYSNLNHFKIRYNPSIVLTNFSIYRPTTKNVLLVTANAAIGSPGISTGLQTSQNATGINAWFAFDSEL
jgi:hypothetical protein